MQLITIGSISLERYQALHKPFEKKYVVTRIKISLVTSWTVGVICMITAWTLFKDSPTLILCDQSESIAASKHLSYKLGIYLFVPLTFISVVVILIFYGRILYLIQKHVKSTAKTLGGKKTEKKTTKKRNKVVPEKESKTKVLEVMVNNFMPPGFSIVDTDFRGSRISLASIGKEEEDREDKMSPLVAYDENKITKEMTEETEKLEQSHKGETKKNSTRISTISQKVLPTISSASSFAKSSGQNILKEFPEGDQIKDDAGNIDILSVSRLGSANFKATHVLDHLESISLEPIKVAKSQKSHHILSDTYKTLPMDDKQTSGNTSGQDSGFCEHVNLIHRSVSPSEQGANITLLTDKVSQFANAEAMKCNANVMTNLPSTTDIPVTSRMIRDSEYSKTPDERHSSQLSRCADHHETITHVDATSYENEGHMNKSFSMSDEDTTGIKDASKGSNNDPNETNSRCNEEKQIHESVETNLCATHRDKNCIEEEFNAQSNKQSQLHVGKNKFKIKTTSDVIVPSRKYATKDTETRELNSKMVITVNDNTEKSEGGKESSMPIKLKKKSKGEGSNLLTPENDRILKQRTSVVQIYDADGQTVKAKTTRQTVAGDICVINTSNKIKGKRKIEAKSAKRAAVVLVTFLIAWLPFPIVIVVSWYLHTYNSEQIQILTSAYIVSMTLSLLAASINPLVYGAINKQFYKEFKKMFKKCKQCCTKKFKH